MNGYGYHLNPSLNGKWETTWNVESAHPPLTCEAISGTIYPSLARSCHGCDFHVTFRSSGLCRFPAAAAAALLSNFMAARGPIAGQLFKPGKFSRLSNAIRASVNKRGIDVLLTQLAELCLLPPRFCIPEQFEMRYHRHLV